jgi:hypothetical protein
MEALKHVVLEQVEQAVESVVYTSPPPPAPPPPASPADDYADYAAETFFNNTPDILDFAGAALFFVCFFTSVVDIIESEELHALITCGEYDYASTPVFLTLGLTAGFAAYALSFWQVPAFAIREHGHLALTTLMFAFWSRHLCRINQLSKKRTNILMSFGLLPLICLVMIKGEHVSVHSKKLLYLVVMCLTFIPVPQLFRDWRTNAYDPAQGTRKKRLFLFYLVLMLFVAVSTPGASHRSKERISTLGLMFDLSLL